MPAFFLALIAVALATAAGRESVRVARLAQALGRRGGLLFAVVLASAASSAFAGWLGATLAADLPPPAKALLISFALLLAALELAVLRPAAAPREPTRSLAAITLVLLAAQLTDAARLVVLAFAASLGSPWLAAAGGAIGSVGVLALAVTSAGDWERLPLALIRWTAAGLMFLAAIMPGLTGLGLLG